MNHATSRAVFSHATSRLSRNLPFVTQPLLLRLGPPCTLLSSLHPSPRPEPGPGGSHLKSLSSAQLSASVSASAISVRLCSAHVHMMMLCYAAASVLRLLTLYQKERDNVIWTPEP